MRWRRSWAAAPVAAFLCAALAPLSAASPGKAPATIRARAVPLRWNDVSCFAYSPKARGYACLDFSAGADSGGLGLCDFETWTPPGDTAWNGHKAVVLVGDKLHVFPISEKSYDHSNRIVHMRSPRSAVKQAIARGYRLRVAHSLRLPIGKWQRISRAWLRFDTWMQEADASFENHGSLRLSCSQPSKPDAGQLVVENNQAEKATAFVAPRADAIAVGFVEVDGGEGAEYYNTDYVRIDLRARCP